MRKCVALALALALALAGCTAASDGGPLDQSWQRVELPAGFVGSQVLVVDGRLVVGGSANGEDPAILVAAEPGSTELASIPLTSASFYGARARWYGMVADGSQLRALGGRAGGGHGNPRWSTWTGDLDAFTEYPVPGIEVFGGPRGGGIVGITVVDGHAVIVGGRVGEQAGLDIAVWLEQGDAWVEQRSAGTAIEASDAILPFPTSVVADGGDAVITGFVQRLGGGEVHGSAALWVGDPTEVGPSGDWQRIDLDAQTPEASAQAATCAADRCVVVGSGDGQLLVWSYADRAAVAVRVPAVDVAKTDVAAPVTWNGRVAIAAADGERSLIAVALTDDLGAWQVRAGPEGTPFAAASYRSTLYVLATASDGSVQLWSTTSDW